MRFLRNLLFRLRALVRPSTMERELHEEFAFHLEMEEKKLLLTAIRYRKPNGWRGSNSGARLRKGNGPATPGASPWSATSSPISATPSASSAASRPSPPSAS